MSHIVKSGGCEPSASNARCREIRIRIDPRPAPAFSAGGLSGPGDAYSLCHAAVKNTLRRRAGK